ncbi:transcription antitermination factor NusB [Patescibacteria group bacterium]|nr:transcription antitermination factor NusB [Patescibacteria group bacterium]MCL5091872.1 transcription antitermination factor NusB [Patescibacteria group bacterium]
MIDPRHQQRIITIQNLYAASFYDRPVTLPHQTDRLTVKVGTKTKAIDQLINRYAPRFPIAKIAKIDLAILRLAIYELKFNRGTPKKVVINEAVELAKELGGERSYKFVNGVLAKIIQ